MAENGAMCIYALSEQREKTAYASPQENFSATSVGRADYSLSLLWLAQYYLVNIAEENICIVSLERLISMKYNLAGYRFHQRLINVYLAVYLRKM